MAGKVKRSFQRQWFACDLLEIGDILSFRGELKINPLNRHDICDMACNRDCGINGCDGQIQRPLLVWIEDSGKLTEIATDLKRRFIMGEF